LLFIGRDVGADFKPRQPFYATAAALSPMGFSQTRQSMTPPPGQSQNLPVGGMYFSHAVSMLFLNRLMINRCLLNVPEEDGNSLCYLKVVY